MKTLNLAFLSLAALLTVSASAFAADCVDASGKDITNDPETFIALISKSASCYEAEQLANACAWGSSMDIQTAGAAYEVCDKEMRAQKPTRKLLSLLKTMESTCNNKYAKQDGTMYRSMNAYCNLSALVWINGIATDF